MALTMFVNRDWVTYPPSLCHTTAVSPTLSCWSYVLGYLYWFSWRLCCLSLCFTFAPGGRLVWVSASVRTPLCLQWTVLQI